MTLLFVEVELMETIRTKSPNISGSHGTLLFVEVELMETQAKTCLLLIHSEDASLCRSGINGNTLV